MDAKPTSSALHTRILQDIRGHIVSGEWPPGRHIPSETLLAAEYSCSRMTVNKAMSELARLGLIVRRRRSGSVVSRPRSQAAILEIQDIRAEVAALGLPYRYELVSRQLKTARGGDTHGFEAGTRLVELVSTHFTGEQPFCLEERFISLAAVPAAEAETFEHVAPGPWLIARVPWSTAEHTIRAVSADERSAGMLDLPRNAACLVVERRTWSTGQPVTAVRLTYSGETHSLVARFTPQGG